MVRRLGEHGADVVQRAATEAAATQSAATQEAATQKAATQSVATQSAATGKNNGIEAQADSASIQMILEPRMIEKNSVRVLGR